MAQLFSKFGPGKQITVQQGAVQNSGVISVPLASSASINKGACTAEEIILKQYTLRKWRKINLIAQNASLISHLRLINYCDCAQEDFSKTLKVITAFSAF